MSNDNGVDVMTDGSDVYVYGAYKLRQGCLVGTDGLDIIGTDNKKIWVRSIVPSEEE